MTTTSPTRLSVNISRGTEEALREITADKGISMTEALRRLVGYGVLVYRADKGGHEALLRHRDTQQVERIVLVD